MTISIDKILSISAQEYIGPGEALRKVYDLKGIHCEGADLEDFAKKVPNKAEVVVAYKKGDSGKFLHGSPGHWIGYQCGVALIPKSNTSDKNN